LSANSYAAESPKFFRAKICLLSLTKILYLAIQDVMKKRMLPLPNRVLTISRLAVTHKNCFNLAAI